MSNPSEWVQFYNQNFSSNTVFGDRVSDATTITTPTPTATAPATASTTGPLGSANSTPSANNLSPDGRVSKPVRKRSRASRRTPTTLLNTDTTNFRAMVQQFTGGPSAPFSSTGSHSHSHSHSHPGFANFNFGLGPPRQNFVNHGGSSGNFHVQAQQIYQQQQQQQQYMFGLNNNNSSINSTAGDRLFQSLSLRPNNSSNIGGGNEGFLNMEAMTDHRISVSSQLLPDATVSSNNTIPSNENRNSNSFMF